VTEPVKKHIAIVTGRLKHTLVACLLAIVTACAPVGPEFVKPEADLPAGWSTEAGGLLQTSPVEQPRWWLVFNDPLLNELIETAWQNNNSLEIAGLRILEARAQLGIAQGSQYPQSQLAAGDATYVSPANNLGGGSNFWQYGIGASASWEIDFWGKFRRGIEAADAAYLSSIAARDQALVLLTAQVVNTYTIIRINEEQLRFAHENVQIQQRSYETIPAYEVALVQARNAMNTLLGEPPGSIDDILSDSIGIPELPETIEVGIPADLLRRRPDVRQAELNALAQNARVGLAQADLYPSFSLTGSIGLVAGGSSNSDFGDLFSSDALTFSIGPSFVWPFLNYDRIRNNVRVQDARLQQALINYQEVAIQAAREAEDAIASLNGALAQTDILTQTVESARRSNELSVLRFKEGFSDYQRVLDAQQSLWAQQQRLITQRGSSVLSLVSLYKSLGGGWENQGERALISDQSRQQMEQRTNWGDLLDSSKE
jgi:outer membrane protein TolC